MERRHGVKDFCRKIMDKFKGGKKNFYWPELHTYCGCCSLETGIYIRSLISLIVSTIFLTIHSFILAYLLDVGTTLNGSNTTAIEEFISIARDPEADLETLQYIYRTVIFFFIMWFSFKFIYMIIVVWTAYAIFKKKPRILKFLLYIIIANCFLDIFLSFIAISILNTKLKLVLSVCNLSEVYNILAVNSQYKRMRGKNRIAHDDSEMRYEQRECENRNQPHCETCTCFSENNTVEIIPIISENNLESDNIAVDNNIVDQGTTDSNTVTQNEVLSSNNVECDERNNTGVVRVQDDENVNGDLNTEKLDIDVAIIYDEQQLNVGTSPVIEDRHIIDAINQNFT